MNAEYPIIDDHAQGQEIEHIGKVLPHDRRPVLPYTFRIESVCLSETTGIENQRNNKISLNVP